MASPLLQQRAVTAVFVAGKTALGHHWELRGADDELVGRTSRSYSGGALGRVMWRTVTVTGMDSDNDIKAEVLDGDGGLVCRLFSRNDAKDRRVEFFDKAGAPFGVAHRRPGEGFVFADPNGRAVGSIAIAEGAEAPWPLLDGEGRTIGVLVRERAKLVADASLLDYAIGINTITDNARDFQNTMHLGFAFSKTYGVSLVELPAFEPLRTFAVLAPVIAGYAY